LGVLKFVQKAARPRECKSRTVRVGTGCGNLYVTIGYNGKHPIEVFAHLGKSGGCSNCQNEALTRSITLGLKYGIPISEYVEELKDLRCPSPNMFPMESRVLSCADAIAKVLKENLNGEEDS
jgi:ribonucleoside-diphosphate reductase alpha chain